MDDSDADPEADPYELIIILSLILVLTFINAFLLCRNGGRFLNKKQLKTGRDGE